MIPMSNQLYDVNMQTTINGTLYLIDEFADGWAWTSKKDEATLAFPTECEALQNAIGYERAIIRQEEEDEDNYTNETYRSFNYRDYP